MLFWLQCVLVYSSVGQSWMGFCAFWTWVTISFPSLRKFSNIISSNILLAPFSMSSPSVTLIIRILVCWCCPRYLLNCPQFFFYPFSFCSVAMISTTLSSSTLICYFVSFSLLWIPSSVFFIKFKLLYSWILFVLFIF